ncbi:MAG: AAA-like domain-containing protein [Deltaproteobacteria bacterium]|nr:AAA-like domain-containing protein [Deltaproteobacteria bacterium]
MNPFKYGDPVQGKYYLDRKELNKSVLTFIESQINVVLIGPRRYGKTSFILSLIRNLDKIGYTTISVDVFNVTSHRDFLNQFLSAITQKKTILKRFIEWLKTVPRQFKPALEWEADSGASPNFRLSLQAHKLSDDQVKQLIADALDSLKTLSEKTFIAFDEFQTIGQLEDNGWLEATIRSTMQLQKNVTFLFSGSRHGIIHDMFNNPSRPFYRSCQLINFPEFGPEFTDWIIGRFKEIGIQCAPETVDYLRKIVDDTPNYVQMACFNLVADEVRNVDREEIDSVLRRITAQNSYPYQTILNSLTPVQQRVLRLAACERKAIYTKDILEKYEIKTGAHVSQAIKSLVSKQILDESTGKGAVIFDDPLFAIWLRNEFAGRGSL